jgi:nicotinamidase/pyrazinamidase
MANAALIVVDVQRDFCEGGALAASDTLSLLEPLQKQVEEARRKGTAIVYTRDWHPPNHSSFQAQGGPWPVHCVADTSGAQLMPPLQPQTHDIIVNKGVSVAGAGYSGFEDTRLTQQLHALDVQKIGVTGIATEYCVRATALDGIRAGFQVTVLTDLIRPVRAEATTQILRELQRAGAKTQESVAWLSAL